MRVAMQESGEKAIPEKVCATCFESLSSSVSQGLKLRMEQTMREKNKMMVWKNRVHLIKNARGLMNQKAYSEAAVQYEKYLRVLEVVYNLKKGELSPAVFNNSSRSKELTVIASVYWDLVRIYDTSPRYGDRMQRAAQKLAQFLQFSPIYPDIVKKAEQFAKNGQKSSGYSPISAQHEEPGAGPCFIATAAFAEFPEAGRADFISPVPRSNGCGPLVGAAIHLVSITVTPRRLAHWIGESQRAGQNRHAGF